MTDCPAADVWQVELDDPTWDAFGGTLSHVEMQRYERIRDPERRAWHRRARIAARMLVARDLCVPAHSLRIVTGAEGKPRLVDHAVQFNVSHARTQALIAVSRAPVGVDVEHIDDSVHVDALLDHVCHEAERSRFACVDAPARVAAFFALWVAKEAYCKAIGAGLRKPMTGFRIEPLDMAAFSRVVDPDGQGVPYLIQHFPMPAGWAAALCSQGLALESAGARLRHIRPVDFMHKGIACGA